MPKNHVLIEQMKRVKKNIDKISPEIYAGIALALYRKHGWRYKRINELFAESQQIWNECVENGTDMAEMCLNETGIDVRLNLNEE